MNNPHPQTCTSFEIRRNDRGAFDVYIDGVYVPWNITDEVTVQQTEIPGLRFVHLAVMVEGDVILDPDLHVTRLGEGRTHATPRLCRIPGSEDQS